MSDQSQSNDENVRKTPWYLREKLLSLSQAAKLFPPLRNTKGRAMHPSTLYRWGTKGRISRKGKLVKLQLYRLGGTNCTSLEALDRFFRSLNDEDDKPEDCNENDADNGPLSGLRHRKPPNLPSSRSKEYPVLDDQYREAMQILTQRDYID